MEVNRKQCVTFKSSSRFVLRSYNLPNGGFRPLDLSDPVHALTESVWSGQIGGVFAVVVQSELLSCVGVGGGDKVYVY